jgi:hypothetical protein
MPRLVSTLLLFVLLSAPFGVAQTTSRDWLIEPHSFRARVEHDKATGEVSLTNDLIQRTFLTGANFATIEFRNLVSGQSMIRAIRPEASLTIDGKKIDVGGLTGQTNQAYFTRDEVRRLEADPAAMRFVGMSGGKPVAEFAWKRIRHHDPNAQWPPKGISVRFDFEPPSEAPAASYKVSVHYEVYDGIPLLVKWLTLENRGSGSLTVNQITTEILAMPEFDGPVGSTGIIPLQEPQQLIVTTDMAFGGTFERDQTNAHVVRYLPDPSFTSQVNYHLKSPCVLEVRPERGPGQEITPGEIFRSFRTFELAVEGDRERRGLAYRRMMRTIAPWVTENPLMMHMRDSNPDQVKAAIDQCAEVGFEMLILSFGSGFDAENDSPDYLQTWKTVADYARSKGIEIGAYSLYASRPIGDGHDMVAPSDRPHTFGTCPAVTSPWGQNYIRKLAALFQTMGFSVFEHDGPYPGDVDTTSRPPLQKGEKDSQWVHWRTWSDFYRKLRENGVYINAPDYYYHQGTNKCGMGYREVNWSLPRAQQLIHTRQNIYDGTWEKTPSMGWMFVPLSEYHGGGAEATIEPLDEHLQHYETMMLSNLAFGVQACYRGPRLFDTPRVRDMVRRNVAWFKKYRDILEGDLIHLRRPDGRQLDGMLHVRPGAAIPGMLCVFNPTDHEISETWTVPLYYTGLGGRIRVEDDSGQTSVITTDRFSNISQKLRVPPGGMKWVIYGKPN